MKYKRSKFNVVIPVEEKYIIYNTATTAMLELEPDCYEKYFSKKSFEMDLNSDIEMLLNQGFIKTQDDDEDYYQELCRKNAICSSFYGITGITISPTNRCNARCYYCYENGMKRTDMSNETRDATVLFIKNRVKEKERLNICWHGGEPLLMADTISYICDKLKNYGINVESTMNTNGILFSPEMIKVAVEKWNLIGVQISIDDIGDNYNLIKKYSGIDGNPFEILMRNIKNLLSTGIGVSLRLNFRYEDVESVKRRFDYFNKEFGLYSNFDMYPAPLFGEEEKYIAKPDSEHPMLTAVRPFVESDYYKADDNWPLKPIELGCLTRSANGYAIVPNGNLYLCQHTEVHNPNNTIGNVFDGVVINETYKKWCNEMLPYEKCNDCSILPICQGGCLSAFVDEHRLPCCTFKPIFSDIVLLLYNKLKGGE